MLFGCQCDVQRGNELIVYIQYLKVHCIKYWLYDMGQVDLDIACSPLDLSSIIETEIHIRLVNLPKNDTLTSLFPFFMSENF